MLPVTPQPVLKQTNRYAVAGDVITQYNTEYASVVWGTLHFLILVHTKSI